MVPEVKQAWVAALRSGEYQQTRGRLHQEVATGRRSAGFCCLGVLCDLAVKAGVLEPPVSDPSGETGVLAYAYNEGPLRHHEASVPPPTAVAWAGLPEPNPDVQFGSYKTTCLAALNDEGRSFAQIADVIEEQL